MGHVRNYWDHGWVVVPGVFSRGQVARVAEIASQVGLAELASIPATPMTADTSGDGALAPRKVDWAFPKHAEFRTLIPLDEAIGAWIALDDADEDNGCLRYIDGSHRGPALNHTPMPGARHNVIPDPAQASSVDWSRECCAVVPAGGVAFHHPLTLHSSRPNTSARLRRAYSSHWVSQAVTCADHTLEWAYSQRVGRGHHRVLAP